MPSFMLILARVQELYRKKTRGRDKPPRRLTFAGTGGLMQPPPAVFLEYLFC